MPIRDQKQFSNKDGSQITELGDDSNDDEIKVYGADRPPADDFADEEDPVTSDELGGDVEGDLDGMGGEGDVEEDPEMDFDDDMGDDEFGDDELDDELTDGSDEEAAQQLVSLIKQIAGNAAPEDDELGDMSDDELEEAVKGLFGQTPVTEEVDYTFKTDMIEFAEKKVNAVEPTDVYEVVSSLEESEASDEIGMRHEQLDSDKYYRVVKVQFENKNVYAILSKIEGDDIETEKANADQANSNWKATVKNYLESYQSDELKDQPNVQKERKYWKGLKRTEGVVSGAKIMEFVKKASEDQFTYVFASDESNLGETFVAKTDDNTDDLNEDAKSLASKTGRNTHAIDKSADYADIEKVLKQMHAAMFAGQMKPFTDFVSDFKKVNQTGGHKGKAPARRGDNKNADSMQKVKGEAAMLALAAINEMNAGEVRAFTSALIRESNPSDILEAAQLDFESELKAFDVAAEGQNLSESFLNDSKLVFETGIKERLFNAAKALDLNYAMRLKSAVQKVQESTAAKLDTYLDYVADEFIKENKVALEEGLRNEVTTSLLESVFNAFAAHNVEVPNGKTDLLAAQEDRVKSLEEAKEKADKRAIAYKRKAVDWMREAVNSRFKQGMTIKEGNELDRRTADLEFKDENDYEAKVADVVRLHFTEAKKTPENKDVISTSDIENGTLLESSEHGTNDNGKMNSYLRAIDNTRRDNL